METIFPPNYDETSNHYYHLGMLYDELPGLSTAKSLKQRYAKDAREAYKKCYAMRCVWYGPQHPETLKAAAQARS